jgi:peptide-methionine (R)-S-oxide reductase
MAHVQRRCGNRSCRRVVLAGARVCSACGSRDSTWVARYRGSDRRERTQAFARKVDAERFLNDQEGRKHRGEWTDPDAGREPLGSFFGCWRADAVAVGEPAPSTLSKYDGIRRLYIAPRLGRVALAAITRDDVRTLVAMRDAVLDLLDLLEVSGPPPEIAVNSTNTSALPSSGVATEAFSERNHFTVRVAYDSSFLSPSRAWSCPSGAGVTAGGEGTARSEPRSCPRSGDTRLQAVSARSGTRTVRRPNERVGGMGVRQDGRPTLAIHVRRVASVPPRARGIRGVPFVGPRCQVRIEGGVMDEQIQSRQRPREQLPSSEEEWRQRLSPEQFEVLRNKGTEHAFTGKYAFTKDRATYRCAACGAELFRSEAKYDSGTGWPSFFEPIARGAVELHEDLSFGMRRIEVTCARCGGHLGHLFDDGPEPTGERYCMNSISLSLEPDDAERDGVVD